MKPSDVAKLSSYYNGRHVTVSGYLITGARDIVSGNRLYDSKPTFGIIHNIYRRLMKINLEDCLNVDGEIPTAEDEDYRASRYITLSGIITTEEYLAACQPATIIVD